MKIPPFSPVLVAGMILPGFAKPVVSRVAGSIASGIWSRHRHSFDRMSDYDGAKVLIDPIDLPLVFLLELAPEGPNVSIMSEDEGEVTATIRGPLQSLLDLAEGRVDGDTLFFNRDLSIEGDTEVVVALRNAVDDAELDLLEEFSKSFGPLARPAYVVAERSASLFQRLVDDADILQQAILSPLTRRAAAQDGVMDEFEDRIASLEKKVKKQAARALADVRKQERKQKVETAHE
jgi:predicted lipid carrier protein YhbT